MSEKREAETANRTGTKRERDHYVGWQKKNSLDQTEKKLE